MATELVPIDQLERIASSFAASRMFGDKTKEQVLALLMLAHSEGVHPAIAMRDFDIINGRPAKKAEAMHRAFIAAGGSIKWHKLDDTCADATFTHPQGGEARITWDMERVKRAKIANEQMYAKYPRQMLRSRCISEGCRTVFPAATSGIYEPGEVAGMEKDMGAAEVVREALPEIPLKVTSEQIEAIHVALSECGVDIVALLKKAELTDLREMNSADAMKAVAWIRKHRKAAAPV
jgi:hypothetical protein